MSEHFERRKNKKVPTTIQKQDSGRKDGLYYISRLVTANLAKLGAILLHLVSKGALRSAEGFGDLTVGDTFRVILPKLNDGIGLRVELTQAGKELLQQHTVCDDFIHRLAAVGDIVAEGTVAVRKRLIQRSDVARRVIFAAYAIAVAFPDEAVRAHAPAVILLLVADAVGFLIESIVLRLGDWHFLAGAANVNEIGLLIVVILHNETSGFRVVPEPEVS